MSLLRSIAESLAKGFMGSEYSAILTTLNQLRDSVLTYSPLENPNLFDAVIAAEDIRFQHHQGFDVRGILRACFVFISKRQLQGASTIDQQLVRVVRNRYELSVRRKLGEIILAVAIQSHFDKATILALYMEVAYFGWRGNGIREICQRLEISIYSMRPDQAMLIAALIKAPMPKMPSPRYSARLDRRISYIHGRVKRRK